MGPFKRRARDRANRATPTQLVGLKPGCAYEVRHWHESYCRRPQGEACTCPNGPDLEIVPMLDPESN